VDHAAGEDRLGETIGGPLDGGLLRGDGVDQAAATSEVFLGGGHWGLA
jgi:hypothetical protein